MRKKILRILILVMLCMFACGVTASAASAVATIGNKKYTSIDKALKAVKNGQTINLTKNLTLKKGNHIIIKRNVRFTLNLNGHTIKSLDTSGTSDISKLKGAIWVKKGNLTVKNGKVANDCIKVEKGAKLTVAGGTYRQICNLGTAIVRKGTITNNKNSAIVNWGTLTVRGGAITASKSSAIVNWGTLTIQDGTIKGKENGIYQDSSEGSVVITGGTFKDFKNSKPIIGVVEGKATISGGNFYASHTNGVGVIDGTIAITGGTFDSSANTPLICVYEPKGTLMISGGTFTTGEANVLLIQNGTVAIKGGTFKSGGKISPEIAITEGNTTIKILPAIAIKEGSLTIENGNFYMKNSNALSQQGGTVDITGGSYVASGNTSNLYWAISVSGGNLTVKENSRDMFKGFNCTVQNDNGNVSVNGESVAKGESR